MRLLLLLLVSALLPGPLLAQSTPPAASPWFVGLKLGTGAGNISSWKASFVPPWTKFTGGVSVGCRLKPSGGPALVMDALLERRKNRPWQSPDASNAQLFLPLYLRTGQPATRVHVLMGAGPSFALTDRQAPDSYTIRVKVLPVEAAILLGLEVRLLPLRRTETTLAINYWQGVTPAVVDNGTKFAVMTKDYDYYSTWLGATLNVYLHSAQ